MKIRAEIDVYQRYLGKERLKTLPQRVIIKTGSEDE
jgi:hypothetical protein